ncbi:MAG: hypothetical protein ABIK09_04670 [Pseudomonadota bacterium]
MKKAIGAMVIIITALALCAAPGCDSGGGGGGGTTGGEDTTTPADTVTGVCDPACGDGFVCVDGACTPVEGCTPECAAGFTCVLGVCEVDACVPDCAGKACGDDGCGALCGACGDGFYCDGGACVEGECTPDCNGKACGDDGCGVLCGTCDPGFHCDAGACAEDVCEPMCIGKECGPDGCDGACGACGDGSHCEAGACVVDPIADCSPTGGVANLRACAEGVVDVTVTGALVTYVFDLGYFIQDGTGAVQVYVGSDWTYDAPGLGDVIDIHVTEYGNYKNQQEILASDPPTKTGDGVVADIKLDLSGGIVPDESIESRVIQCTGLTVETLAGADATVAYGGLTGVPYRVEEPGNLCVGATFDLATGVVTQYEDFHQLKTFYAMDIANVDTAGCAPVVESDASNWGFEEISAGEPPPDFEKLTMGFTALTASDVAHGGSQSCVLTWTSQDNQDLGQGYYVPIAAAQTATFSVWVKDNDIAGRIRLGVKFYDADKIFLNNEFSSQYSTDADAWAQLTYPKEAPAGAAFVRGFVRMYDVSADWDGNATIHIDDWNLIVN